VSFFVAATPWSELFDNLADNLTDPPVRDVWGDVGPRDDASELFLRIDDEQPPSSVSPESWFSSVVVPADGTPR